jgi:hypothetical protein
MTLATLTGAFLAIAVALGHARSLAPQGRPAYSQPDRSPARRHEGAHEDRSRARRRAGASGP